MELAGNVAYADIDSRESVLSRWFDAYGTDVLRLCCFYLGSRADAEDATQETFLKAWKHMDRFHGRNQCTPKTWLMKIAATPAGITCAGPSESMKCPRPIYPPLSRPILMIGN